MFPIEHVVRTKNEFWEILIKHGPIHNFMGWQLHPNLNFHMYKLSEGHMMTVDMESILKEAH